MHESRLMQKILGHLSILLKRVPQAPGDKLSPAKQVVPAEKAFGARRLTGLNTSKPWKYQVRISMVGK